MERDKKKDKDNTDVVIGVSATERVGRYGMAAGEYLKGYKGVVLEDGTVIQKGLKQVAESKINPDHPYRSIKQQAGFSAEIHYVNKENADSMIVGEEQRIYRSNDLGRGNDPQFDVLSVDSQGNPSWGAQMKFYGNFGSPEEIRNSARNVVDRLADDKWERYRGNPVLIPKEQYETAKAYAREMADAYKKQAESLRREGRGKEAASLEQKACIYRQVAKDLKDSGISSREAVFLREHPKLATAKYVAQTAHRSGIENAKSAAVLSGSILLAQNIVSVARGEKQVEEAACDIGSGMASGAAGAYILGSGDTVIRGAMNASGSSVFASLSKTNVPALIATATIQAGKSLVRYANGEIDSLELVEELGEKGTGMMAASFGAAVGTLLLPGIGTTLGSMAGYMTSSVIYGACMQALTEERFTAERRKTIHSIAETAIETMERQSEELMVLTKQFYAERENVFQDGLRQIQMAVQNQDTDAFTQGLNRIVIELGETLQFRNFDEFDEFMSDEQSILSF